MPKLYLLICSTGFQYSQNVYLNHLQTLYRQAIIYTHLLI
nr:MAG TPA_asm: hypothetical protein [Bacteriophage sp.]